MCIRDRGGCVWRLSVSHVCNTKLMPSIYAPLAAVNTTNPLSCLWCHVPRITLTFFKRNPSALTQCHTREVSFFFIKRNTKRATVLRVTTAVNARYRLDPTVALNWNVFLNNVPRLCDVNGWETCCIIRWSTCARRLWSVTQEAKIQKKKRTTIYFQY